MHDKPLSKLAGHLLRRLPGASHPTRHRVGPDTFSLDEERVLRFAEDRLDPAEESRLALATTDWLRNATRRSAPSSAGISEMRDLMTHLHKDINEAGAAA
ncbi:hypothetical protein [Streptomyces hirsutus]|uniref:hypothetical protein n=1 Tax=Streptomyces hirsutus TaxID=35620 RepID=UPI00368EE678